MRMPRCMRAFHLNQVKLQVNCTFRIKIDSWPSEVRLLPYKARFTTHIYKISRNSAGCTRCCCVCFCLSFLPLWAVVRVRMCAYQLHTLYMHACKCACVSVCSVFRRSLACCVYLHCLFVVHPRILASTVQSSTSMHICSVYARTFKLYI